jgi:hypothetical protein
MKTEVHYCRQLRALLIRVQLGQHTFGLDAYRWLTGLSVFHWRGMDEVLALDFGRVGG